MAVKSKYNDSIRDPAESWVLLLFIVASSHDKPRPVKGALGQQRQCNSGSAYINTEGQGIC